MQENDSIPASKKPSGWQGRKRRNEKRIAQGLPPLPQIRQTVERETARKRQHALYQQTRQERYAFIAAYKMERGCADCGYKAHPAALDFDHLPGQTKVAGIPVMIARAPMERLLAEMAKCEVVCANCHRIRTANRR